MPDPMIQQLWDDTDLPEEAFEQLAQGGFWRIPEYKKFSLSYLSPRVCNETYRIACYKGLVTLGSMVTGNTSIYGKWEDTPNVDYQYVGYINYT